VKKFGSDQSWSRKSIWSNNALSGHVDFLTKKTQKIGTFGRLLRAWFVFGTKSLNIGPIPTPTEFS
jgi:hypothetical protein